MEYDEEGKITQGGFSAHAYKNKKGVFQYSAGAKESNNTIIHVDGSLSIQNDGLNMTYENLDIYTMDYITQLPNDFKKLPVNKARQAMYTLPFNTREINGFPFDLSIEKADELFGNLLSVELVPEHENSVESFMTRKYTDTIASFYFPEGESGDCQFFSIETACPNICFVRNIRVGDSLKSVISKFPIEKNKIRTQDDDINLFYGELMHLETYGRITCEENGTKNIWYADGYILFKLEFDSRDYLLKMSLSYADWG